MQINLIAVGKRMPAWVDTGFATYQRRLPRNYQLNLIAVPSQKRLKNQNAEQILEREATALLDAVPAGNTLIALERSGQALDTLSLANTLQTWHDHDQSIALLIGGPEGLAPRCIQAAHKVWSLSALTLPHPLVRIVVAEQIYRAFSILTHHPYHR